MLDVIREPVLILGKDLRVVTANRPFYQIFQVNADDTEGKIISELGNGQWAIPALQTLLENILLQNTSFKGFEVVHEFPSIGHKVMLLNARQIHFRKAEAKIFPPIIILAMEDVTDMMMVAEKFASYTSKLEKEVNELRK